MVHLHFHKQVPVCKWSLVMVLAVEIEWDACEMVGWGRRSIWLRMNSHIHYTQWITNRKKWLETRMKDIRSWTSMIGSDGCLVGKSVVRVRTSEKVWWVKIFDVSESRSRYRHNNGNRFGVLPFVGKTKRVSWLCLNRSCKYELIEKWFRACRCVNASHRSCCFTWIDKNKLKVT